MIMMHCISLLWLINYTCAMVARSRVVALAVTSNIFVSSCSRICCKAEKICEV